MNLDRFEAYLHEIKKTPLLSPEEERALGVTMRTKPGSPEADAARQNLILANLRLVLGVAIRFASQRASLDELTAAGSLGLIAAADGFDPTKSKCRFSTYATWWITLKVRDAAKEARCMIRIPRRRASHCRRVFSASSYLHGACVQNISEIAAETKLPEKAVRYILARECVFLSIHQKAGEESDCTLEATIPDEDKGETICKKEELQRALAALYVCLTPVERDVIVRRFGLGTPPHTLGAVGKVHNVSGERVRRIQDQALRKLRGYMDDLTGVVKSRSGGALFTSGASRPTPE